jgi:hypothetical protein
LLRWCKHNLAAAVAIREAIYRSVLLEHITKTGELPAGAAIAGGENKFYVR